MKTLLTLALGALLTTTSIAADKPELTVYTYDSFVSEWGPGPAVKEAFEAQCDCSLNFVALDKSATLLSRLQLEGKNSQADVVLGLDNQLMAEAEATGLFAPAGIDTKALKLPVDWDNNTFIPYDYGFFAFVYDSEKLTTPPASLAELIDNPDGDKIIIEDPRTSTPGLGLLLWMKSVYGDQAAEKWAALQPRILSVTKGWSEAYFSLFLEGEAPLVLSYSTSPAYHMAIDKTERYQAAKFTEGHVLQVEVAARLAGSDQPELAQQFLQFMLSRDFQSALPLTNVMYPATDIGDKLPAEFGKLIDPQPVINLPPAEVAKNRKAWIDEWLEAMSR